MRRRRREGDEGERGSRGREKGELSKNEEVEKMGRGKIESNKKSRGDTDQAM